MKVIFIKDVPKYGKKYEIKNVSDGFAMNMLLPRGEAVIATDSAIKKIELMKKQETAEKEIQDELFKKDIQKLLDSKITLKAKANEKGHLFAGIDSKALVDMLNKEYRTNLNKEDICMDKPIKSTGITVVSFTSGNSKKDIEIEIVSTV
jgi:large subunit ribosomal protein L9